MIQVNTFLNIGYFTLHVLSRKALSVKLNGTMEFN